MISRGVEISIAGRGGEIVRGPIAWLFSFFFFFFFFSLFFFYYYHAFIVFMYKKPHAALAMERTKPINQNNYKRKLRHQ